MHEQWHRGEGKGGEWEGEGEGIFGCTRESHSFDGRVKRRMKPRAMFSRVRAGICQVWALVARKWMDEIN